MTILPNPRVPESSETNVSRVDTSARRSSFVVVRWFINLTLFIFMLLSITNLSIAHELDLFVLQNEDKTISKQQENEVIF